MDGLSKIPTEKIKVNMSKISNMYPHNVKSWKIVGNNPAFKRVRMIVFLVEMK